MHDLKAENLTKFFGKRKVVDSVSFSLAQGQVVSLLGPNGAGKTTTFYMVVGLLKPISGRVLLDGEDLSGLPMYRRARLGISYLPQEPSVFRNLTVADNIMAILETQPLSKSQRIEKLDELLEELNLTHLANSKAHSLSGGERRRVEITRALVNSPRFFLMDEPFAGIDPIAVADIQQIIRRLKEKGIGVLITDHNERATLGICDIAYLIYQGRIEESGPAAEVAASPRARQIYLGDQFVF
jgi:lipopolysaccharide export system ATP-binding protein